MSNGQHQIHCCEINFIVHFFDMVVYANICSKIWSNLKQFDFKQIRSYFIRKNIFLQILAVKVTCGRSCHIQWTPIRDTERCCSTLVFHLGIPKSTWNSGDTLNQIGASSTYYYPSYLYIFFLSITNNILYIFCSQCCSILLKIQGRGGIPYI